MTLMDTDETAANERTRRKPAKLGPVDTL